MRNMRVHYILLSAAFFSFFLSWSLSFALFPIWLRQTIGLDGGQSGILFSANALASLIVMPCYGFVQDRFGLRKNLLFLVAAALILTGPFFVLVYAPLLTSHFAMAVILGGFFFAITFGAGVGALEAYIERASRLAGFEFGRARMWGSLGWAAASAVAGYNFNIAPEINFWSTSLAGLIFLGLIALVHPLASTPRHGDEGGHEIEAALRPANVLALLKSSRFWGLATFVMGVSCVYSVYDQQFPAYFSSLFPTAGQGNVMYGYLNAAQVFVEAGGMFLAPALVNRIGPKHGLILSGAIMAIRMIGSGLSDGALEISMMKMLHAIELPIMIVALFKYIAATFDPRLSATLYIVGFQFMTQIAASLLSVVAGRMYDSFGFAWSYVVLGSIVAAFTWISSYLLIGDPKDRSGNSGASTVLSV